MKTTMRKSLLTLAIGGLSFAGLMGCTYEAEAPAPEATVAVGAPAPDVTYVQEAPPPPQVEVQGPPPGVGFVWIGGFWNWDSGRYVWHRGYWGRPGPGYHAWEHDRWEHGPHGYYHVHGHWR